MTRRLLASAGALGALALLAVLAAAAGGNSARLRVVEAGGARFPERGFVLTLPTSQRLAPSQLHVLENGVPVSSVSLVPVGADRGDFGVVLVVDASNSMRGTAIVDAMAAARAFAARRRPNQQLAVVTFNQKASVLLSFTADSGRIDSALAAPPPLDRGTHVYDGVATALELLRRAKIASGSIVVLSDGADTGSQLSAAAAAASARGDHVRIFSVGIRSHSFQAAPLKNLAVGAGGNYSEASSTADLTRIYAQLGVRLAGEYLLRYRSRAGPNAKIRVKIRVEGIPGTAISGYVTPPLPRIAGPEAFHRSLAARVWQSALTMFLIALLAAGLFAVGIMTIVRPRGRTLRARISQFVSLRPAARTEATTRLSERVLVGAERSLETTKWWARFVETLELAEIRVPAVQLLLWTFVGTFFAMWILTLLGGSLIFGLLGLGIPFTVRSVIKRKVERRRAHFAEQLPDNLQVLASALRAGHSFVGALSVVVEDAAEPSRSEFRRVVADEQLGVPIEDAISVVVRRMDNRDLHQVGLVAALQRETGGNMAEVLDRVTETIRERFELRRMVQTLTAQGRMSRWIVSLLPVVLLAAISALNPKYVEPLYKETSGRILLVIAGVMLVTGSLVIKRIVNIKV